MLVFAVRILEGLFILGVLGCIPVLILTSIEDLRMLFGSEESEKEAEVAEAIKLEPSPLMK